MQVVDLPMDKLYADTEFNCRGSIAPFDVFDLKRDIEKHGLLSPIIVQPMRSGYYRIVAGYRRHKACLLLKLETIPCIIRSDLNELQARSLNLKENVIRKQLNVRQEAFAIQPYIAAGWKDKMIADELQQSSNWVYIRRLLLGMDEAIQQEAAAGMLTQEHIRVLASMPPDRRHELVRQIKEKKLKGESAKLEKKPRKISNLKKRQRLRSEIQQMIEKLCDVAGMALHTRCMAWCAGNISTYELLRDFQSHCKALGIEYQAPEVWE